MALPLLYRKFKDSPEAWKFRVSKEEARRVKRELPSIERVFSLKKRGR
jgi:hypothetical protein